MKRIVLSTVFLLICTYYTVYNQTIPAPSTEPIDYIVQLTTSITESPASVSFKWKSIPGDTLIYIYRKNKSASDWGNAIATLPSNATEYTDNDVEIGVEYTYKLIKPINYYLKVVTTYVSSGIKCKEVENRGKVILLVDSSFVDTLRNELNRYETDLKADGWEILRKDISRNAPVKYVKSIITDFYNTDTTNVKAVILFGHIPVPYSGCCEWDHEDHIGAWPADMYYGVMNEDIWTDDTADCSTGKWSRNWNIPGDGKFDLSYLPSDHMVALQVGRIDFSNLPAFPYSESELLRNYLTKNHEFRYKIIDAKLRGLIQDNLSGAIGFLAAACAIAAWSDYTALFNSTYVNAGNYLIDMKNESYIWSFGCGTGKADGTSCGGVGTTEEMVVKSPKTVFTSMYGSYLGDW
jgi:hypothetical protein